MTTPAEIDLNINTFLTAQDTITTYSLSFNLANDRTNLRVSFCDISSDSGAPFITNIHLT